MGKGASCYLVPKVVVLILDSLSARTVADFRSFRDEFRASISPRTEIEARLVDQQLGIARESARPTVGPMILAVCFLALANIEWVPVWRLVTWPLLFIVVTVRCNSYYDRLRARSDATIAATAARARAFAVLSCMQVIVWCSMSLFLWAPGVAANQVLLVIALSCTLAGWTSVGATHLATGVLCLPAYLLFMSFGPVTDNQPLKIGMVVIFWLLMTILFRANYSSRERFLKLQDAHCQLIVDLKAAKDESDTARGRAETASLAKSAFLANMSHELRTPLNAILGFSEIIQTRSPLPSNQYAEYGGYIHSSGQHLLSLINDILDLAKIESGRLTLHETEIEMRGLMESVVLLVSGRAQSARVHLSIEIQDGFPDLIADERAIRQIFANLTSNALKFTPANGCVLLFANVADDGSLTFGVADSGVGIAEEDHQRVFESFGQGRHDTVCADHGTGLGLPIVRGLAEAMGGYVTLESTPDQGACISVTLPAVRALARFGAVQSNAA